MYTYYIDVTHIPLQTYIYIYSFKSHFCIPTHKPTLTKMAPLSHPHHDGKFAFHTLVACSFRQGQPKSLPKKGSPTFSVSSKTPQLSFFPRTKKTFIQGTHA